MAAVDSRTDASRQVIAGCCRAVPPGRGVPPGDYFQQLLSLICEATHFQAAVAWGIDDHGVLAKIAEIAASDSRRGAASKTAAPARANRLLDALMGDGPHSFSLGEPSEEGPAAVELLVPFRDGARPCGVIEVVIPAYASPESIRQVTAIVCEIAGYAARYVASQRDDRGQSAASQFAERMIPLVLELHRDPCVSHVALTAVNEGRSLLGCDRLSLAARRGRRMELIAVSGQEQIVTRSNLAHAMKQLATALGDAEKPLRYDGELELLPPQLHQPIQDYINESGARCVGAIPLRNQLPAEGESEAGPRFETTGWLLCEDFQRSAAANPAHVQALADHVAVALANAVAMARNSTPFRRVLRLFFAPAEFRTARRAALAAAGVLAMVVVSAMAPVPYRVEAIGRLMPVRRNEIFAPTDGRVKDVLVDGNQTVVEGQVLLRIDNERLASELLTTRHTLQEKQQLLATLEAQNADLKSQRDNRESIRLSGAISQTRIEIASTQSRLHSLEAEAGELEVRAPLDGTVATFAPRRTLLNRPVQRGESLLEVMDTAGPWELQLELPARQVGHVLRAQSAAGSPAVAVQFTLATEPETVYTGALRTVASRILTNAAADSVAPVAVDVAVREIAHPVAGADVIARVHCGRRALARVLFGDIVDYFRSRVW